MSAECNELSQKVICGSFTSTNKTQAINIYIKKKVQLLIALPHKENWAFSHFVTPPMLLDQASVYLSFDIPAKLMCIYLKDYP